MPTPADQQLAEDIHEVAEHLAGFRVEVAERFGVVNTGLKEIQGDLRWIKWIGGFFATALMALIAGAVTVSWNASALNSEVKHQGGRLEALNSELKHQGGRLEAL